MPIIVQPDQQVLPQPMPNVRVQDNTSPTTFGYNEQSPAAIERLAQTGGEIAAFENIRANQIAVSGGLNQLSDSINKIDQSYMSTRESDAIKNHEIPRQDLQKAYSDAAKGLNGQIQLDNFNLHAGTMMRQAQKRWETHFNQQTYALDNKNFTTGIANGIRDTSKMYGDPASIKENLDRMLNDATAFGARNGFSSEQLEQAHSKITSDTHEAVLSRMIYDPKFTKQAESYLLDHKDDMSIPAQERMTRLLDVIPRQRDQIDKHDEAESYKANMRQSMLDMFDGKLTLSEAQRRFRDGELDKSDYSYLESRLSKPDAAIMKTFVQSDPSTFNEIRHAQLTASASPGEIQRMIAKGAASKKITPEDGKYLVGVNDEKPPTPRDKYIESQANNIRDFGMRYFAESNFLGHPANQDKTSAASEALVNSFYNAVDQGKANNDQIDEIRDRIKKTAMQERYPGLGSLDQAPDIVIGVDGKVTRLLNPDQRSSLKPRFRVVSAGANNSEQ